MLDETILYERIRKVAQGGIGDNLIWMQSFNYDLRNKILDLIRDEQLTKEGIDEAGQIIGLYSYVTELISKGKKKFGDPYNLNDTGAFYRSMFVTVLTDSIVIDAGSPSYEEMQTQIWWNDGILGLTDTNLQIVINEVKERYRVQLERLLHGT